MKNTIKNISLAVLLLGAVPALSAATFDFVAYTDNDSDNDGYHEWGYDKNTGFLVTEDGIGLLATATALTKSSEKIVKEAQAAKVKAQKEAASAVGEAREAKSAAARAEARANYLKTNEAKIIAEKKADQAKAAAAKAELAKTKLDIAKKAVKEAKTPTWEAAHVYLDGGNAGLGVCKVLDSESQCNPGNDDNVTSNEALKLAFDREVTINEITFTNGEHGTSFDGNFWLSIDGGTWQEKALTNLFKEVLVGSIFEFKNSKFKECFSDDDYKTEFYIGSMNVSAVPVPTAAFLFAPALLGFMGLRRKAKKSVA